MASLTPLKMPAYDSSTLSSKEAPVCVQKAMVMKERKPFTYTPGGLDLSEIKSEKMAKRLMRNALNPGLPETPKTPTIVLNGPSMRTPVNYYNMPVAVFPSIQIPHNAKQMLRKTNGPNRRDSFECDTNSPKIQEKNEEKNEPKFEEKLEINIKNNTEKTDKCTVNGEHKENIPIQETEVQIKKTTKTKKIKEKTGTKLKKKVSKVEKTSESSKISIKEEKQKEEGVSRIEIKNFNSYTNEQKECTESEIKIDNSENVSKVIIKNETSLYEKEKEVRNDIKEEKELLITNTSRITCEESTDFKCNEIVVENVKKPNNEIKTSKTEDISIEVNLKLNKNKTKLHNVSKEDYNKNILNDCDKKHEIVVQAEVSSTANTKLAFDDSKLVDDNSSTEQDDGDVTPKVDLVTKTFETIPNNNKINEKVNNEINLSLPLTNGDIYKIKEENVKSELNLALPITNGDDHKINEVECELNLSAPLVNGDVHKIKEDTVKRELNLRMPLMNGDIHKIKEEKAKRDNLTLPLTNGDVHKMTESRVERELNLSIPLMNGDIHKIKEDKVVEKNNCSNVVKRENSNQIISRRKSDNIKSLNTDLDNLPSLNLCSKRFSFLSDSPSEEDPFSILTGIPAKLSVINRDKKKSSNDVFMNSDNINKKCDDNIPKFETNKFINEINPIYGESCNSANSSSSKISSDSYGKCSQDDGQNFISTWSSPKLFNDFSFREDDNIPAWKKELLDIANKKKETKDDCEDYKEVIEPPWRRELRELAQSRVQKQSAPSYNVWNKLVKAVESPTSDEPLLMLNPVWSQTLNPKTWKERKADLTKEKEVDVPEWKNAATLRRNFMNSIINKSTSSSSSCSSPGREIGKPPEVMIEITGQPIPAQEQRQLTNGYTNPWESSSESSTAFSPEPYTYERTPTPQSRSSPYAPSGMHSPVIAREFGAVSYQPNKRLQRRSCPIQSKSFKYLQMLTGTSDGLEDDEPFIPQSPQHSHLKEEND